MNFGNTNWNLYKTFVTVYETGNLHKAADLLGITYSAVWQNLRTLGDQLGFPLFTSHTKGVVPTGDANNLYPDVKSAVNLLTEAETSSQEFTSNSTGTIRMSISDFVINLCVKDYLQEFCAKYPKVKLHFAKRAEIDALSNGKIDFAIEMDYFFKGTELRTADLFTITASFIASKHFLAKHGLSDTITKDQLAQFPIIAQGESWEGALYNSADLHISVPTAELAFSMVKSGFGIGFYGREGLSKHDDNDVVVLNIKGFQSPVGRIVCGYKNLSRPASVFLNGLIKFCKK